MTPYGFQFLFIPLPSEATLSHQSLFSHLDTTCPYCPLLLSRRPLGSLQMPVSRLFGFQPCCSAVVHQQVVPLNVAPRVKNAFPCAVSPARRCTIEAVFTVSSSLGSVFFIHRHPTPPPTLWLLACHGPCYLWITSSDFPAPFPENVNRLSVRSLIFHFHASYHLCSPSRSFLFGPVFFFKCVAFAPVINYPR